MDCKRSCVDCATTACDEKGKMYPDFCLTESLSEKDREKMMKEYAKQENKILAQASALVETEGYMEQTRVEETINFAKKIGAEKIGIATCVGLIREARILAGILRNHGFQVYGIACKVGAVKKTDIDIEPKCMETGKSMCNPIGQAQLLNKEKTDLNIVIGLCVGHDSLFYKYSEAVTTTLVVKDRVMGHNPVAALYTAESYYKRLKK